MDPDHPELSVYLAQERLQWLHRLGWIRVLRHQITICRKKPGVSGALPHSEDKQYSMRSMGTSRKTCLFTSAVDIKELAIVWTSAAEELSRGKSLCDISYCQSPSTWYWKQRSASIKFVPKMPKNNAGLTSFVCRLFNAVHLNSRAFASGQYVAFLLMVRGASLGAVRSLEAPKRILETHRMENACQKKSKSWYLRRLRWEILVFYQVAENVTEEPIRASRIKWFTVLPTDFVYATLISH